MYWTNIHRNNNDLPKGQINKIKKTIIKKKLMASFKKALLKFVLNLSFLLVYVAPYCVTVFPPSVK